MNSSNALPAYCRLLDELQILAYLLSFYLGNKDLILAYFSDFDKIVINNNNI